MLKCSNNELAHPSSPASAVVGSDLPHAGKRSTIYDVARFAGVSHVTVSNYINGKGRMGHTTRERIRVAMEVLHFAPNAHTKALREGRTRIIGILPHAKWIPDTPSRALLHCSLLQGINEAADEAGYDLLLFTGDHNRHRERDFLGGQIDGLLYLTGVDDSDLPRRLSSAGLPTIGVLAGEGETGVLIDGAAEVTGTQRVRVTRSGYRPNVFRDAGYSAVKDLLALIRGNTSNLMSA